MGNKYMDTQLFDRATAFALKAHANTERRGKGTPYIIHCMEAASIVASITADPELLVAAMLHDVVEDTDYTEADIRKEFGDRIADLVASESDLVVEGQSETQSWRQRKQFAIDRLAKASRDAKIVAMGDKLSNMRAIAHDYNEIGDALWERFHADKPEDHEWHYRGLANSLAELRDTEAFQEFSALIDQTFRHFHEVPAAKPIDMDEWEAFGDGYTAVSYYKKGDDTVMMKLYEPFVSPEIPLRELTVAQAVLDAGIPTPKPLDFITADGKFGVSFERVVNKRSIARAVSQEPEKTEAYAQQFARMCKELHAKKADKTVFGPITAVYEKLINGLTNFTEEEKKRMLRFLTSVPDTGTCIHGDLHGGNALITDDGKEYFIDLADFCYGNPLFDIGTLYYTSMQIDEPMTQRLFHCGEAQMHRFWNAFAKAYFNVTTDEEVLAINETVAPFAALKVIFFAELDQWAPGMRELVEAALLK